MRNLVDVGGLSDVHLVAGKYWSHGGSLFYDEGDPCLSYAMGELVAS